MTNSAVIAQARQLHKAGNMKGAFSTLTRQLYGQGYADELREELERLFPATPDVLKNLAEVDQRLRSRDAKVRKQAARQAAGLEDHPSADGLSFCFYPQTRALFIEHLASEDAAVRELMAFALANCFRAYVLDQRAYEPLLPLLTSKLPNTRAWASEALGLLGERATADLLPLTCDKSQHCWQAAFSALNFGLEGGGTLERQPWGASARRAITKAMLQADRSREVAYREWVAALLALSAETADLTALQAWQKKDGSKSVKKILLRGIDRLQSPAQAPVAASKPKPRRQKVVAATPTSAAPPTDPAFFPCQYFPAVGDIAASLMFTDFAATADSFAELNCDGGGYGWHGVVDALVRLRAPHLKKKLSYNPEASMFVAISRDESALREVAALVRAAQSDETLLCKAIREADPKLME